METELPIAQGVIYVRYSLRMGIICCLHTTDILMACRVNLKNIQKAPTLSKKMHAH